MTHNDPTRSTPSDPTRRVEDIPRRGYERTPRQGESGPSLPPPVLDPPPYMPPPVYSERRGAPPPPRRGRRGTRPPRDNGLYLPWWSLVLLVGVVGVASLGLVYLAVNVGGAILLDQTPQIIIVTGQFQPTPITGAGVQVPTALPTQAPTPDISAPTALPSATPLPGQCLLNAQLIVFGTGGVGLNLRDRPGGRVAFIAKEGERMVVIGGPEVFEGITWCQVRSDGQSSSFGWAAMQYLLEGDE